MAFLRLTRKVIAVCRVVVCECTTHGFRRQLVIDAGEQATTDDFEGFLGAYRFPQRLNSAKVVRQGCECFYPALAARFFI
ncbi:hypothetical protein GALL_453880 [mine drainage metagenome]|uniref:Uncharacterized protein n=1 Tax=mine drainage metagenome TaxID=410659 RepID=A0A1J5PZF8_9ZZZZ